MTTKDVLRKLVDHLPENATLEDVQYQLYVLQKLQAGQRDLEEGRVVPHEQVLKDLARWVK